MNITLVLAWRNLWRHKRRTWLTVGAMVFSNALLIFSISLQWGSYSMMIDNSVKSFSGYLQVQTLGYLDEPEMRKSIPAGLALSQTLREQLQTDQVAARAVAFALASSQQRSFGVQITGVEPGFETNVSSLPGLIREGVYLSGKADEIVIGSVLARNLKLSVGDEVTLLGSGRDGGFAAAVVNVVGIIHSGFNDVDRFVAQMPLASFQDVFGMQGHVHSIVINPPELDVVPAWQSQVAALLDQQKGLVVHDWTTLQPGLKQAIQADMASAWFMYGILIVLVAFGVMNTQLMSVLERTHEFGTMMALGLSYKRLARLVMLEALLMSLLGFVMGCLLGSVIAGYFNVNGFSYPGMEEMAAQFNMSPVMYPEVSFLALTIGPWVVLMGSLLGALYPAARLRKLEPLEAMQAVV